MIWQLTQFFLCVFFIHNYFVSIIVLYFFIWKKNIISRMSHALGIRVDSLEMVLFAPPVGPCESIPYNYKQKSCICHTHHMVVLNATCYCRHDTNLEQKKTNVVYIVLHTEYAELCRVLKKSLSESCNMLSISYRCHIYSLKN